MLLPKSGFEFSNKQGNYIKTFPLHESQRIVEETNDTVLLEIYIHTTNDIIMELLKYGRNVSSSAQKFSCHYEERNGNCTSKKYFTTIDLESKRKDVYVFVSLN
jgi:hypothetical protein